jgi:GT2 family glycosyltransferase
MKTIIFVADFFIDDIIGGGELNNDCLIEKLSLNYNIIKIKSNILTIEFIELNKDNFFIIANFVNLSEATKNSLLDKKYIIYEHDHKYLTSRNPSGYSNFLSSEKNLINQVLYKNARAVFAQSKIHAETIQKNLLINNIINCAGNLWHEDQLNIIKKYKNNIKKYDYGILQSSNQIKNTYEAISYCEENKLNYILIPFTDFESYISKLSECKNFVFFPKVLETLSRTSIEAKLLSCKLITNNYLGVASEDWIRKNPDDILKYIEFNASIIIQKIISCIEDNDYNKYFCEPLKLGKISIITSLYKAEKYIDNFLKNIIQQTIFDECELILINANSPEKEEEIILPYLKKYSNIRYIRLEKDPGIYGCWNIGINESTGEYICNSNVDDMRLIQNLEILRKHLHYSENIDLVYGDSSVIEEIPILNKSYTLNLSDHSIDEFSKSNLIKCLPGPLPLWKKEIHKKYGLFSEKYQSAGDWEMWLRAAKNGSKFKKVDTLSGYYYNNPTGKSTNKQFATSKFLEEKEIFFNYKDVFGKNYELYLNWFGREI